MRLSLLIATTILSTLTSMGLASGNTSNNADEQPILTLSDDDAFNFDILSSLQQMISGAADLSPVLAAVKNIVPGDWDSFTQAWFNLANETKNDALRLEISADQDPVNFISTWFSVATYFRRADTYNRADWDDPRINDYWNEQRVAFDKAIAALPVPAERVKIPADKFTVEAIWYPQTHDSNATQRFPTLILGQGYDAAQEDLYATLVVPALDRGWNVLSYEGPGQPAVLREQQVGFIPDWERVVTPVVDYLLSEQSETVDPNRLALFGNSFGGYLNARAAALEPRISALMLDGGIWDMFDAYSSYLTDETLELFVSGQKEAFDQALFELPGYPEGSTTARWGILQGLWSFKIRSPYEFFQATKNYTLKGGIADGIHMPVWIADGEYETLMAGQSQLVKDALGDRAELHFFEGPAGFHCQTGATQELARVVFAWLDKMLPS